MRPHTLSLVPDLTHLSPLSLFTMKALLLLASLLFLAVRASAQIVGAGFVYETSPYPSCHASTLAENSRGEIVAAWFGGTRERDPDVCIYLSRRVNGRWLDPILVADGVQPDGKRLPTWNPVLFQPKDGPLFLFYKVGPHPSKWWGLYRVSEDGGITWEQPVTLPTGVLGPIKNKPVVLADGSWLSPSSTEGEAGWQLHFERSRDGGKTWELHGPVPSKLGIGAIQPSLLFLPGNRLAAVSRTRHGVLATTWSDDNGSTWKELLPLGLPCPNSGTDAVTLADGRQLLVYNHSATTYDRPSKGVRYPIDVAVSDDGLNWRHVLTLDAKPCDAGYAYPSVIQAADGLVHISYTWDRKRIKHVVLDPALLEPRPADLAPRVPAKPSPGAPKPIDPTQEL